MRRSIGLIFVLPLVLGCAGAPKKQAKFAPNSVTKIAYDPASCKELPNGTFKCKDVTFTVGTVEYK